MAKAGIHFSPLSERVYLGRTNNSGVAIGEQRDITSDFLQVMEMKFPINTTQIVSINGENKYRVIVVDLDKEVVINGKQIQKAGAQ